VSIKVHEGCYTLMCVPVQVVSWTVSGFLKQVLQLKMIIPGW
jgi:hypothetical protein